MNLKNNSYIDLHVHLDGSVPFFLARKLAASQGGVQRTDRELEALMVAPKNCQDLNDYLTKFEYPLTLLQTEEGIAQSVCELLNVQASQGIIYSEIRFAPQLHIREGLSQKQVVAAALSGRELYRQMAGEQAISSNLILCCMRGDNNEDLNMETVETAGNFLGKGVAALDLAGAEALFPTNLFKNIFKAAKQKKIPFTIHAGEARGAESIWEALDFGAFRIGHGIRCLEDRELTAYLAKKQIPLELCPTSNLNTRIFSDIRDYPLLKLLDAGVCVTVNTDNMTVSNTTVQEEFRRLEAVFHLGEEPVKRLLLNAANAAFVSEEERKRLREKIIKSF